MDGSNIKFAIAQIRGSYDGKLSADGATIAIREKKSHIGYLEALLLAEMEERERNTIERRFLIAKNGPNLRKSRIDEKHCPELDPWGDGIDVDSVPASLIWLP